MLNPTVSSRAAAARATLNRYRSRRRPGEVRDPCPGCQAELAAGAVGTRRLVVFGTVRGVFTWRCPDCLTTWSEVASRRPGSPARDGPNRSCEPTDR